MGVPHLYSLEGRIGRREFALTVIGILFATYFATFLLIVIGGAGFASMTGVRGLGEAAAKLAGCLVAAHALWTLNAAAVKRCHDRGLSGWMLMFAMPPLIGQIWLCLSLITGPGDAEENRFGEPPRSADLSRDPALA